MAGRVLEATKGANSPLLNPIAEAFAVLASRLGSDRAFAVLVFEALKYPWIPVGPLGKAVHERFSEAPEAVWTENVFWPLVNWAEVRFNGVVDFEAPPRDPAGVAALVQQAMSREK